MGKPLDELYFEWLYGQVGDPAIKVPTRTYWRLLKLLYKKEFVWFVPNDDNRIADGKDLRYEFVDQARINDVDLGWVKLGVSMLELMIALSRALAFEAEGEPRDWFWHLMNNLGLLELNDTHDFADQEVDDVLERLIWRNYSYSGEGGLFPLRRAERDQRDVELWYQLCAYVLEMM